MKISDIETLAACGNCGWAGDASELRHPEEYADERASSYQGRDPELEGGREFCPQCDDSAQVWDRDQYEEWLRCGEVDEDWDTFKASFFSR